MKNKIIFLTSVIVFFYCCKTRENDYASSVKIEISGPFSERIIYLDSGVAQKNGYWYDVKILNNKNHSIYFLTEADSAVFFPFAFEAVKKNKNSNSPITGRWEISGKLFPLKSFEEKKFKFYLEDIPDVDSISFFFKIFLDTMQLKMENIEVECLVEAGREIKSIHNYVVEKTDF